MHKLLARLIRKYFPKNIEKKEFTLLFDYLSKAFDQQDEDRLMLERSLLLTSGELNSINEELRDQLGENKTNQLLIEESLAKQNAILDATPEALYSFKPGGKLALTNKAGCKLLGVSKSAAMRQSSKKNLQAVVDQLVEPEVFTNEIESIELDKTTKLHGFLETKKGKFYEYYSVPEILDGTYIGRVWCFRDITNIKKNEELLKHQAFHDALTDLPNRSFFMESLQHAIKLGKRNNKKIAVLFIDLDDFKKINDTVGHQAGDQFLIDISAEIFTVLRECDILGRLGGDEFLVLLENIDDHDEIFNIHERILHIFQNPFSIKDKQYKVSCSIGTSIFPQDGDKPEELIRKADMAMYQAKRNGKNSFHYFDESLDRVALHRVLVESNLGDAIKNDDLILHFQPKVNILTGEILGVEALVRWQQKDGSLIYPNEFIGIAESTGLIYDITQWVLRLACKKLQAWEDTVLSNVPIAINISAADFSVNEFLPDVYSIIQNHKIATGLLEFELTESVFLNDLDAVNDSLKKLKSIGIMLSIDDFGTGYSSFQYLHNLDFDYLKIDRSFVQDLSENERSKAIVKSIIDVGVNLGVKAVAEGIETETELQYIAKLGCHIGQGYLFSGPLSEEQLYDFAVQNKITNK